MICKKTNYHILQSHDTIIYSRVTTCIKLTDRDVQKGDTVTLRQNYICLLTKHHNNYKDSYSVNSSNNIFAPDFKFSCCEVYGKVIVASMVMVMAELSSLFS